VGVDVRRAGCALCHNGIIAAALARTRCLRAARNNNIFAASKSEKHQRHPASAARQHRLSMPAAWHGAVKQQAALMNIALVAGAASHQYHARAIKIVAW